MVTMAQSAANWRNTHTHVDARIQFQPRCAKRQLSYNSIRNQFLILKVPEGGRGSKPEYPKNSRQPARQLLSYY